MNREQQPTSGPEATSSQGNPELRINSPNSQFADVFAEAERGEPVNAQDLINALWWKVRNQRREIARLHAKRVSGTDPKLTVEVALKEAERCARYENPVLNEQVIVVLARELERLRLLEFKDAGPIPHGVRYDITGWLCSVCGAFNSGHGQRCKECPQPGMLRQEKLDPGPPWRESGESAAEYDHRLKLLGYSE